MPSSSDVSRRRFLELTGTVSAGALAGCTDGEETPAATATAEVGTTPSGTGTPTDGRSLLAAIDEESMAIDLTPDSAALNAVAARLAESRIVGLGENSHGVAEFKTIPQQVVRRLVADHGYRLLAMEGTLGDFAPVNAYVTGDSEDLDAAVSSLEFYFWRTAEIRRLFEWLRGFNEGRPESERVVVRGYDAQYHDVNAAAIRSYLERVDPAYLNEVENRLNPLTKPLYERSDPTYLTDSRRTFVEALRARLQTHREAYAARSSDAAWELANRHVWTLERGLRFLQATSEDAYTRGKRIRDRAMAENLVWLREWTGSDRVVVMGNSNHTMRNGGAADTQAPRMGQHLTDRFGDDYYSLGMLFGTGRFSAPTNHRRTAFTTHDLDDPLEDTLASTLVDAADSSLFLDFASARDRRRIDAWLDDTSKIQFTVPRAADRGAVGLPAPPGVVYDGVVFVRRVSPASFLTGE